MLEIVVGIAGAIAGALVVKGIESAYWSYAERRATWKGEWLATLPPFGIRSLRKDRWLFHQRGGTVFARIVREEGPSDEIGFNWSFVGQERESQLFGAYESGDPHSLSYGGIMLTHTGPGKYDGFYLRLEQGKIVQAPISLERR